MFWGGCGTTKNGLSLQHSTTLFPHAARLESATSSYMAQLSIMLINGSYGGAEAWNVTVSSLTLVVCTPAM
jgi:hypothetical protein